ncbi:MAG: universal stress protein [Actinobacteria bacterium]|nr:universal stress protein [Actinomycetota bacterium]
MSSKPIVVGTDGSDQALIAVEWATLEAVRRRLPLRIVAVPLMPSRMHATSASPVTVAHYLRENAIQAIDTATRRAKELVPEHTPENKLLGGAPAAALIEAAKDASMLVVGAHGGSALGAMVLGSVSRYAALHAPCPIVVARQESMAAHGKVVAGVADPAHADDALAFAFEEAAMRHSRLTAVHVVYQFPIEAYRPGPEITLADGTVLSSVETGAAEPPTDDGASAELATAVARWHDKYPQVRVRRDVVWGHPARVLADYSSRADLLVIGRHGPAEGELRLGAIQHPVLAHAHSPVAIIPSTH